MPIAHIRGVNINYEVLGTHGPWVALSPGGRRDLGGVLPLAEQVAQAGYRVLLHDRRNCGASDVVIAGDESEYEIWADDLYALLSQLDALPACVGGSSSGCRLSLLLALRHPEAVRALLLWRVTGGPFAAQRLAHNYYGQFIEAAQQGGMPAVCDTEFFRERIASNPANREHLLHMQPQRFIDVMTHWRTYFLRDAHLPVIGASTQPWARSPCQPVSCLVMIARIPGRWERTPVGCCQIASSISSCPRTWTLTSGRKGGTPSKEN